MPDLTLTAREPGALCLCGCGEPAPIARENMPRRGWSKGKALSYIHGHNQAHGWISDPALIALHRRYLDGEKIATLASELGRQPGWLYYRFDKAGLKRQPLGTGHLIPAADPRAQQALALWDSGIGGKEIAKKLHLARPTIARLLRESGRDPLARTSGEGHPNWNGGRSMTNHGYVLVKVDDDDPLVEMRARRNHYALEHRLVMARHLGRPLRSEETVHHKNGRRDDNRLENLQLRTSDHGPGAAFECADCGSQRIVSVPLH